MSIEPVGVKPERDPLPRQMDERSAPGAAEGDRVEPRNVELGLMYAGVPRRDRSRRAADAIERVGLSHRANVAPATLSGGERPRVAIARALCVGPEVLLCDEPTGNLDSHYSKQVLALLDALHGEGTAVIVVTHDPVVASHADRIFETEDGEVTERSDGPPRTGVQPL